MQISLLRINNGEPVAVGNIDAAIEDEPQVVGLLHDILWRIRIAGRA